MTDRYIPLIPHVFRTPRSSSNIRSVSRRSCSSLPKLRDIVDTGPEVGSTNNPVHTISASNKAYYRKPVVSSSRFGLNG